MSELTGKSIPDTSLYMRVRDESVEGENPFRWDIKSSLDIFKGKRVVVFALPGAFTPTCSSTHLPGYEAKYDEVKAAGIDEVYCLSVNDAFVMFQWAKQQGLKNVKMLPDGNGDLSRGLGMLVEKQNLGFGPRSWRYSMVVNDGVVEQAFIEPGYVDNCPTDPFEVSDVETMLAYLQQK